MREILFRGKRVDNGEWVEGNYILQNDEDTNRSNYLKPYIKLRNCCNLNMYEVIPETVGQFTGLTDKNGKKIFEGDIMRNAGNVVEYLNDGFCVSGDSPLCFWTTTEVIGNVHDNKEE